MNLAQTLFGAHFQNPVMLASGTCGYGEELDGFLDIDELGGLVTKAVTVEARGGNAAPRVAEFAAGMLNSVGLANVGLTEARTRKLPWLASRLRHAQVLVNVAGKTVDEYAEIVKKLDDSPGFLGYELNVSCPNVKEGGAVFSAREDSLGDVVRAVRRATRRPVIVKLAPNVADIGRMAEVAAAEGADGLSLINTFPGLLFDVRTRTAVLGAGTGGVSGPAVLPMGVHAVWQARRRVGIPILGMGGIRTSDDALQYIFAGASLVQIGTASFADPRTALRVLSGLRSYGDALRISELRELVGSGSVDGVPAGPVG